MMENSDQSHNRQPDSTHSAELQSLLAALVDGDLTDDQFQRLEAMLADDPVARADYHRQLQMHALLMYGHLHEETASQSHAANRGFDSAETFAEYVYRSSNQTVWQNELQQDAAFFRNRKLENPSPLIPDLSPLPELGEGSQSVIRTYLPWFTTGILGMALLAVIAVSWIFPRGNIITPGTGASSSVPSVHILSGTTKLMLPSIGYVTVDGPAEFDILGPMRARLNTGRIKMCVTEETGHGFVVETPYGNVTDLGTEFGLDVSDTGEAGLVVFDGAVDLEFSPSPENPGRSQVERLVRGEGVVFGERGQLDRIMSIVTGNGETFQPIKETESNDQAGVIVQVSDNRDTEETKKFYEIVRGGLREDALAYVDRPEHEWNGVSSNGLPKYLIGADYIKPFCNDKTQSNIKIGVTLSGPAKLYILFDSRLKPPRWLKKDFVKNGDVVGLDVGRWGNNTRYKQGKGPGVSIDDRFNVWEKTVNEATTVVLGVNTSYTGLSSMYGIAAVPLKPDESVNAAVEK